MTRSASRPTELAETAEGRRIVVLLSDGTRLSQPGRALGSWRDCVEEARGDGLCRRLGGGAQTRD
jgi:hypothetical protein